MNPSNEIVPSSNAARLIAVTGAGGQLGRLVIAALLKRVPARSLVGLVRSPSKAADLAALGIELRQADYEKPESLRAALEGVSQVLLISSSEIGRRLSQHRNVIEAAAKTGVGHLAYTSLLHADRSPLDLATEHRETEALLRSSVLAHTILRNGWYTENYTASAKSALAHGALAGSAGQGRISSATRADFAEAAAQVLCTPAAQGKTYELAGDQAYSLAELAAELSRQTGKNIPYTDLPEAAYAGVLLQAGLPEFLAKALARWDVAASKGALFDDGRALSALLGRPTTPLATAVREALAASG